LAQGDAGGVYGDVYPQRAPCSTGRRGWSYSCQQSGYGYQQSGYGYQQPGRRRGRSYGYETSPQNRYWR
jgi:hypothetical protein